MRVATENVSSSGRTYSRAVDHLGILGKTLRDLVGFGTLAHELIQNAIDGHATQMRFDSRDDALVVDNDGVFSDCGHLPDSDCPWSSEGRPKCDFHRFRFIGAGDKRNETETVGAFGIGFTAVYQVTDHPEIISAGHHWILDESAAEADRIRECAGCSQCRKDGLPGTRIVLPWARDPTTAIRRKLGAEPVSLNAPDQFLAELEESLPLAVLFLEKLDHIDLAREGESRGTVGRLPEGNQIILSTPTGDRIWTLVTGDFDDAAARLREKHGYRIEEKRRSTVSLAIPLELGDPGLLCAFLPTQQRTGLPFHINADLFTRSDRKGVILDAGFQAEWNVAALQAAAKVLAEAVPALIATHGHLALWRIAESVSAVTRQAKNGDADKAFVDYWDVLSAVLRREPSVELYGGGAARPTDARLLERVEEQVSAKTLTDIGIRIVAERLRPFFTLLRSLDVQYLDIDAICDAIAVAQIKATSWPPQSGPIADKSFLERIWAEIELLEQRRKPEARAEQRKKLVVTPIVLCDDGSWRAPQEVYSATNATQAVCRAIGLELRFAAPLNSATEVMARSCVPFTMKSLVLEIEGAIAKGTFRVTRAVAPALFTWLEENRVEAREDEKLRVRLRTLPIYPSGKGFKRLDDLSLPGGFDDPLSLGVVVDLSLLGGRRDFLRDLGGHELTFELFVERHVPKAIAVGSLTVAQRRAFGSLIAKRLGEVQGNAAIRKQLSALPVVECADGVWRKPDQVYFDSATVTAVLGSEAPTAKLPAESLEATRTYLEWVGVAAAPRVQDTIHALTSKLSDPANPAQRQRVSTIVEHLGHARREGSIGPPDVIALRSVAWVPVKGDLSKWARPNDVYTGFQENLFATVGPFADIPIVVQRGASDFLDDVGMPTRPSVSQVVTHTLKRAKSKKIVTADIYRFLAENAKDPAISRLRNEAFIHVGTDSYARPSKVFWGTHKFGRWRHTLGGELRQYQTLFEAVGVREAPEAADAISVLLELEAQFPNRELDSEARSVAHTCWSTLTQAFAAGEVSAGDLQSLTNRRVVPGARQILEEPSILFFDDQSAVLARFPTLANSTIPRVEGAWQAMEIAGVQAIGRAAKAELLEAHSATPDLTLRAKIEERISEILRVLAGADPSADLTRQTENRERLGGLTYTAAESILIHYRLSFLGKEIFSAPEKVAAVYLPAERELLRAVHGAKRVWVAVARELARAVSDESASVAALAAGLGSVLAAESADEASQMLDDLGFRPLEIEAGRGAEGQVVSAFAEPEATGYQSDDGGAGPASVAPTESLADQSQIAPHGSERPAADTGNRDRATPQVVPQKQARLRSYVSSGKTQANTDAPDKLRPEYSALDRAGIERVMNYERQEGRDPHEMPHSNPGYDIESRDAHGRVQRFIEVKSTGDRWGDRGVALSDTQFEWSRECQEQSWLYVVVRPEEEDFRIYRINQPTRHISEYIFDGGWVAAAEPDRVV